MAHVGRTCASLLGSEVNALSRKTWVWMSHASQSCLSFHDIACLKRHQALR